MVALAVVALIHTLSIAAFSLSIALVIAGVIDGAPWSDIRLSIGFFLIAVLIRAATLVALDAISERGGSRVKSQLRARALTTLRELGPSYMERRASSDITNLLARGIDALDLYFGRYLPQLVLTAIQMPVLLIILWVTDLPTGIAITLALPVIPIFMVLIGWATQAVQKRQWEGMQLLSRGFMDLLEGLSTLKIFGRQWRQVAKIRDMTSRFRQRTMAVLRVSFLSSFVLELAASFSVAIVAVSVGIRLVDGGIPLWLGLFVLILVPEVYLPLRAVGAQFHNAAEGVAASEDLFEIFEATPESSPTQAPATLPTRAAHTLEALSADQHASARSSGSGSGRSAGQSTKTLELVDFQAIRGGQAVHEPLTLSMHAGQVTLLEGPSGAGKTSIVHALLGFAPAHGHVLRDGTAVDVSTLRDDIAWAPQQPSLLAGSVAGNITLGSPTPRRALLLDVLTQVGLERIDPDMRLGVNGSGLSGGQAQRVALARALYRQAERATPLVLLDEVTSAVDSETEEVVWDTIAGLAKAGALCLVVSHRLRAGQRADQKVSIIPTGLREVNR